MLTVLLSTALAASPGLLGAPVVVTPLAGWATDVTTGDFNGDGLPDISLSSSTSGSWSSAGRAYDLELSLSDGAGGFTPSVVSTSMMAGYRVMTAVADLDGDGLDDLVAGHYGGFTAWFSDGATLATSVDHAGARVGAITTLDVDNDGDPDVVTLVEGGDLNLYDNDGAGGLTLVQSVPTDGGVVYDAEWDTLLSHDLDSDGNPDLALLLGDVMGTGIDPLVAVVNDGAGRFDPALTTSSGLRGATYDLAVGDVDSDGVVDFAFVGGADAAWSVPWSGGFGSVNVWPITTYGWQWVMAGDVDGDGDDDLVGTVGFDLGVLAQDAGTLTDDGSRYPLATTVGWVVADDGFRLADMNDDGCDDVVTWIYGEGAAIVPATSSGCAGATPTAWTDTDTGDTGDTGVDTGDTGSGDTGSGDTGGDTGAGDTSGDSGGGGDDTAFFTSEPPPSSGPFSSCGVTDPGTASLAGLLGAAGLVARRRRGSR